MFASSLLRDGKHNWLFSHSPQTWKERRTSGRACGELSPFRSQSWLEFVIPVSSPVAVQGEDHLGENSSTLHGEKTPQNCVEPLLRPKFALNTTGEAPTCIWEQQQHKPVPELLSLLGISGAGGGRSGGSLKLLSNILSG